MPRGVYERTRKDVVPMNEAELKAVEEKAEGVISPLPPIEGNKSQPVPGTHRVRVGNFIKPALMGDGGTLKRFQHVEPDYEADGWVSMSWQQMHKYQKEGLLVGWNADKQMGLLKQVKSKGRER